MDSINFKNGYCFAFNTHAQDDFTYVAETKVMKRVNQEIIDTIKTTFNIQDTNRWLDDSQTEISTSPIDWNMLTNEIKKTHLAYFFHRIPIENNLDFNDEMILNELYC